MSATAYQGWAIVELFGHIRFAGKVSEIEQYGTKMIRIEIPEVDGAPGFTTDRGGGAIFGLTPTTEEIAREVVRRDRPTPPIPYSLLPRALPAPVADADEVGPETSGDDSEHEKGCRCPECEPDEDPGF